MTLDDKYIDIMLVDLIKAEQGTIEYFIDPKDNHSKFIYDAELNYNGEKISARNESDLFLKHWILHKFRIVFEKFNGRKPNEEELKEAEDNIIYYKYKFEDSYYGKDK